mgnify:CR=1 FL=1
MSKKDKDKARDSLSFEEINPKLRLLALLENISVFKLGHGKTENPCACFRTCSKSPNDCFLDLYFVEMMIDSW